MASTELMDKLVTDEDVDNDSENQKSDTHDNTTINTKEQEDNFEIKKPNTIYLIIKRCFDFLSSFALSLLLLLPLLVVSMIIIIKDPGNPFYSQKRIGTNGKPLNILKFRSMKKGADNLEKMLTPEQLAEYKKEFKLSDDPRLIGYKKPGDASKCFGAMIRKLSIDELPQIFWNICIKGNMSVVGPRPIIEEELDMHYSDEQKQMLLSVKPGLTGYWQAYARNNATYTSGERQRMELYYVSHCSLLLDIKILFKTVVSVIKRSGAN